MKNKIIYLLTILLAIFLGYVIILSLIKNIYNNGNPLITVLFIFLTLAFSCLCIFLYKKSDTFVIKKIFLKHFWIVLLITTVLPRLVWILNTNVQPISDFNLYDNIATELINGPVRENEYIALFPHIMGYPFVLSFVYKIFGHQIIFAQLFNVLCSFGSSLLIYKISKNFLSEKSSKISALICSVWVSQIFFSTIVSTEALFAFLFLLCLYIYFKTVQQAKLYINIILFITLGLMASFANAIRPLSLILIIAVIIHTFLNLEKKLVVIYKKIGLILILIVVYSLSNNFILYSIQNLINIQPMSNSFGYTFLVGSNISSHGGYNSDDSKSLSDFYFSKKYSNDEVNQLLINKTFQRISENIPNYVIYYISKNSTIWSSDSYGVDWNKVSIETVKNTTWNTQFEVIYRLISNIYYIAMILLSLLGLIIATKRKMIHKNFIFIIIVVLGFVGAHMLTEVQERYHYAALPLLAILSAYGIEVINGYFHSKASINT